MKDDIYYRDKDGNWVKLPHGKSGDVLAWKSKKSDFLFFIACLCALIGFSIAGYNMGYSNGRFYAKVECMKTHKLSANRTEGGNFEYTVLDADHVIMNNGDTVVRQWNNVKMRK